MDSKFLIALPKIEPILKASGPVFRQVDLKELLKLHKKEWHLRGQYSTKAFTNDLINHGLINEIEIKSKNYQPMTRLISREPSPFAVALSLKPGSYLSHGSAIFLHGLTKSSIRTLYVNKEQSAKPNRESSLNQESITRAFANQQRSSNYIYSFENYEIVILGGKNTQSAGVEKFETGDGEKLYLTGMARTLVDITVRPKYAGGPAEVLKAFDAAKKKVDVAEVVGLLSKLKYVYPYHQAIGFYMQRAGYPAQDLKKIRELGMQFDFYLDYGITSSNKNYDRDWRIYFPNGL